MKKQKRWLKMVSMPSEYSQKEMMKVARSKKNPDNSFFIDRDTGQIVSRAYRDNKGYFPNYPTNTYEVHISKEPFLSYADLKKQLCQIVEMLEQYNDEVI
jgi:hypothetical protein